MTGIRVDKNVPAPDKKETSGATKYPWAQMEVGDSFFQSPREHEDQQRCRNRLASLAYNRRVHQQEYRVYKVIEDGVPGARIWRVK